jgi:hypothetical protein
MHIFLKQDDRESEEPEDMKQQCQAILCQDKLERDLLDSLAQSQTNEAIEQVQFFAHNEQ